jgi:hypothetical protein
MTGPMWHAPTTAALLFAMWHALYYFASKDRPEAHIAATVIQVPVLP